MIDPRLEQLAQAIIGYSVNLQPGENILIECIGPATQLASALVRQAYAAGGRPFVTLTQPELERELLLSITAEQLQAMATWEAARMKEMQAYVGVRAPENSNEQTDVPPEKSALWRTHFWRPVHTDLRVPHTKWCVLRYPTPAMAQSAGMSTAAFEEFYFQVCNLDYSRMSRAMDALVALMERTDQVRVVGPGDTDLTFSIKGIPAVKCAGDRNLPDGEVYTAPVRESVNGVIAYNTPATYQGVRYDGVRLTFRHGRIVEATANDPVRLNQIFDTDEGARYVGEFSLGVNPHILHPMNETLFDEKISGSIHFTPGSSYDEAFNGNKSAVHWDLVLIQRPDYGGGEVWFDGRLIRRDGRFVLPELEPLNPENLK
ncbi:MAG: aminopeptidase [Bacillota bacterium]|nr:aminopeptidase [Bacillota bacterium]